jgi:hypothetical protein
MILYSRWCALPLTTRNKIAEIFNIPKKGAIEVSSNEIKADGYFVEDIEKAITVEALQDYLQSGSTSETDLSALWSMMIDRVEGRTQVPVLEPGAHEVKLEKLPIKEATQFKEDLKTRVKVTKTKNAKTKK